MKLRMTNQREIILRELKKSKQHLTARELHNRVIKDMPRTSLATVYRNLETFYQVGLVGKLEIGGREKRFDYDVTEHDHVCCAVCHKISNLNVERQGLHAKELESVKEYTVTGYKLEVTGTCLACQKKKKK
jgi:Fur family ferric uptake transcriptional regulator